MARIKLLIEGMNPCDSDSFVLKFSFPESGIETEKFVMNVRSAKSYSKWQISMNEATTPELLEKTTELFQRVVDSTEFEISLGKSENSKVDGELLWKLIQLTIWIESITCINPEFVVRAKNASASIPLAKRVMVTMA